jgi:hypothetical protein
MKFISSMRNSLILVLLTILSFQTVIAQSTTFSPFSGYGLGDRSTFDHGTFTGIGNCRITYFDSTTLNYYNPSTYNTLSHGYPIYSLGINSRYTTLNDNGTKNNSITAIPDHFAMAFTLKKYFGLAFGLRAFQRKGYEINERISVGTDSIKNTYLGRGGIHEVFLGFSTDLIHLKSTRLSIGGNLGYVFGTSTNERQSLLITTNNATGGVDWTETKMNTLHYEFGANFTQKLGKKNTITLAGVYEPAQKLSGTQNNYLFYGTISDPELYDTLSASTNQSITLNLASKIDFGGRYQMRFKDARKDNSERNSEIALHVNYMSSSWTSDSANVNGNSTFNTTSSMNYGIQYTPEINFMDNSVKANFMERMRYRAGYYSIALPYAIDGLRVYDKGVTLGFGIPIVSFRTLSSVNLSFSAGERSNFTAQGYKEQYIGFNFGISLSPSNFDKWFVKRKLD